MKLKNGANVISWARKRGRVSGDTWIGGKLLNEDREYAASVAWADLAVSGRPFLRAVLRALRAQ